MHIRAERGPSGKAQRARKHAGVLADPARRLRPDAGLARQIPGRCRRQPHRRVRV